MDDFIFGTLATDALRLAHLRARRAGVTHANRRSPRDPSPGQPISLELTAGPDHLCDRAWAYWSTDGVDPQGENGVSMHGNAAPMQLVSVEWDTLLWGYVRRFRLVLPGQPEGTLLRYRLAAGSGPGLSAEVQADEGAIYACYVADDPPPAWAAEAVVYQIFVDRFFPGEGRSWLEPAYPSGFYGGTLQGITQRLDYIAGLGVDVLWLTPIFPSPSHHGYDASDYFEIEPRLGTKADLRALLDAAHARGLRVLLDFVPNHWSSEHASFQAATSDPLNPYAAWYTFTRWPDEYETFFGVKTLPQLNLRHPPARQHILDATAYWLEFGVDGYRLDYAIGPVFDFWADFRRASRAARPDCWTFGEVVEPSDSQIAFDGLLDGCLDFLLLEALRQAFGFGRWTAARFADFLDRHEAFFPPGFSRPSFLDNHDMNRFLWMAQGDQRRLKLAALCQFSLVGPPVIYYGTEVGLSQERDVRQGQRGLPEESRLPMLWGEAQDTDLLAYYKDLIALRRSRPSLSRGVRRTLQAGDDTMAYLRAHEGEHTLAVFNLSGEPRTVGVEGRWARLLLASQPGCHLDVQESCTRIDLPALGGALLEARAGEGTE